MINSLLYKMGYHTIESEGDILGRSSSNWQNNREHLYAKYIDK